MSEVKTDLVVLVPCLDIECVIQALLARPEALGLRHIKWDIRRHPMRDSGCRQGAGELLRPLQSQYSFALVVLDRHGSGRDNTDAAEIEKDIEGSLSNSGWENRNAAIVIDPEVEIWVWSDSPEVDRVLGWQGRQPPLRTWLTQRAFVTSDSPKPSDPKEALAACLKVSKKPFSAALFDELASKVSLQGCTDRAFLKLRKTLADWFGDTHGYTETTD